MKTVLIVDDESSIRRLMAGAVAREGYEVLEAEDGARALGIAAAHDGPIHLLITDIRMPGLDGWELAARLTGQRSGIGVIYVSGHCIEPERRMAGVHAAFLAKPFTMRQLLATVGCSTASRFRLRARPSLVRHAECGLYCGSENRSLTVAAR